MPAVYPGDVRNFETKIDLEMTVFALHMNDVQDEITAIQRELGTLIKGTHSSVRVRLEQIEATKSATTHDHSNRLNTATHDVEVRHTFGGAFGTPATPTAITPDAGSTIGTGDNPAKEDHGHGFDVAAIANAIIPAGTITAFGGTAAPTGWALCNGAAVARGSSTADPYYRLFQIIGTQYGVGNGTSTFNLPNLQDRFPLGRATPGTAVASGGTKDAVVAVHSHGNDVHTHPQDSHQHGMDAQGSHKHPQPWLDMPGWPDIIAIRAHSAPFRASDTGGGWLVTFTRTDFLHDWAGSHGHTTDWRAANIHNRSIGIHNAGVSGVGQNMPPYQTVNYLIKL